MAGNYNYNTLMSRDQFYNEYAPISKWASYNRANFSTFKDSQLFSSPGYRKEMVSGSGKYAQDFNNNYNRYTTLFNERKSAQAQAAAAVAAAKAEQERLKREAEAERLRIEQEAAARIKASRMSGSAIQASNEILATDARVTTPQAVMTKKRSRRAGGARTTGSSLRIGQTSRAAGSGSNLSI